MIKLGYRTAFLDLNWNYLAGITAFETVSDGGQISLYSGSSALGGITGWDLTPGAAATKIGEWAVPGSGGVFRIDDLISITPGGVQQLVTTQVSGGAVQGMQIGATGGLGGAELHSFGGAPALDMSQVTEFTIGAKSFLAGGAPGQDGLAVYEISASNSHIQRAVLADHAKTSLADVTDIATVEIGASTFIVTGSGVEGGVSSYRLDANGNATLTDTVGAQDGLWISGLSALATVTAGQQSYVVVAGTNSSSLSLLTINEYGALAVTNHITDTLDTRFANIGALETFSLNGRGFVAAGGGDDGLSLFEILPDNTFYEHQSLANESGWTLDNVTAIKSAVLAGEVQIFAAGAQTAGMTQFTIPTGSIATPLQGSAGNDTLTGTAADDLIFGAGGADTLTGGAGDDIIYGGAGADKLSGGAGADVFVFDADLAQDQILDFELGTDKIDLGRWGRLYDASSLTITPTSSGAQIAWGDFTVQVVNSDASPIFASQFGQDSFRFTAAPEQTRPAAPAVTGNGSAVTGLGGSAGFGELALGRSDDGSARVDVSSVFSAGFNYFGSAYSGADLFVNTNGTLSFGSAFSGHPSAQTQASFQDVIAPFWADIDTRLDGGATESGQIWVDQDAASKTVTVTYENVGGYRLGGDHSNLFQVQLTDRGAGDFDIRFIYDRIGWSPEEGHHDMDAVAMLTGRRLPDVIEVNAPADALHSAIGTAGTAGNWIYEMRAGAVGSDQPVSGLALAGTDLGETLEGGAVDDFLRGLDGNDILRGHDGADWLRGGDGSDILNGGTGDDFIFGGASQNDLRDVVYAGDGNDTVDAGYGNDLVYGGLGDDQILGDFGADELIGQGGNDILSGGALSDVIFGGDGADFINGGFGHDRLNGGAGADRLYHLGIFDHGSDWVQDYSAAEGDLMVWGGGAAQASDFQINYANTPNAGATDIAEAFIIHRATGQIIWALVDGAAQDQLNLRIGTETFDLML